MGGGILGFSLYIWMHWLCVCSSQHELANWVMAWRERSKTVCFGAVEGQPFVPICRLSHVTSIHCPGWDESLERGLTPCLICTPELTATVNLPHQQPGKCQSAMREESRSFKWQDWRFPSPLTQLGWVPLQIVPIQPLLDICLGMISRTLRDDSGCGIAVGGSVHARVIQDNFQCEPANSDLTIRLLTTRAVLLELPPPDRLSRCFHSLKRSHF